MSSHKRIIFDKKESIMAFEKYKDKIQNSSTRSQALDILVRAKYCLKLTNEDIERLEWIVAGK